MSFEMQKEVPEGTVIKVVGVGGAGGNAIAHMIKSGVQGVEFICANTDAQALKKTGAMNLIQLGESGLGAGAKPEVGRAAAEENRERIGDMLRGANMVFITAGMGGGTGTGAAPVIAQVSKEMGILTVAVVSKPFGFEGARRMSSAEDGLRQLEQHVDSLIVVLNDKLEETLDDDVCLEDAFEAADEVLHNAVAGIAEIINISGHINVDFQDVRTVMGEQGRAMMGTATVSGPERARLAAEEAIASPLLDGVDLAGARGILINISAAKGAIKLREQNIVVSTIRERASEDVTLIYGVAYDDNLGDKLRVTVVATGLSNVRNYDEVASGARVSGAQNMNAPVAGAPVAAVQPVVQAEAQPATQTVVQAINPADIYVEPAHASSHVTQPMGQVQTKPPVAAVEKAPRRPVPAPTFGDYGELDVPTFERRAQQQAPQRTSNGDSFIEDLDVPAFLRRQAD